MNKSGMFLFIVSLWCLLVLTDGSAGVGVAAESCQSPQEDQWIYLAASEDSTTSFRSSDLNYCLTVGPDTTTSDCRKWSGTLVDSTGSILWKKRVWRQGGRDVIAISNRGEMAVLGKRGSAAIGSGPGVSYETEGPARIHADIYDRNGDLIREWNSNPYSHGEDVLEYVHCLAFHPSRELLVVGVKAQPSLYDEGAHVYGVALEMPVQWRVDLGWDFDPVTLDFRGDEIVVTWHRPRASADSALVLTPYGELRSQ